MITKCKTEYYFSCSGEQGKDKGLQENLEYLDIKIEVNEETVLDEGEKEKLMKISFYQKRWMTKQDHIKLYKKIIEILENFNH